MLKPTKDDIAVNTMLLIQNASTWPTNIRQMASNLKREGKVHKMQQNRLLKEGLAELRPDNSLVLLPEAQAALSIYLQNGRAYCEKLTSNQEKQP